MRSGAETSVLAARQSREKINEIGGLFNQNNIIDLSFYNFRNAITAANFANEILEILKVNDNFRSFFPAITRHSSPLSTLQFLDGASAIANDNKTPGSWTDILGSDIHTHRGWYSLELKV